MKDYDKRQQQIYSIVMDGADAPKPDEDDVTTVLLWYEMQISVLVAERDEYKNNTKKKGDLSYDKDDIN